MSARTSGKTLSGRQQASRSHEASDSQSKTQISTQETPKRKLRGKSRKKDVTPDYQTPARRDTRSSERTPRMLGRATPYRTPRLATLPRQRITGPSSVKKADAKVWKGHLQALLNKTMKICNLSSLANFKYNNERLRVKYEKILKNRVMEVYPSGQMEVKLTTTSCLSWKSSVVDAVWLEVTSLFPGDTPGEDKLVVVYSAWLFRTVSVQSSSLENVDWLPVMLYSGRELIHQVVVNWLQGSFECYVARSGMQQSDFLWIAGVWTSNNCLDSFHSQGDAKVEFTYMIISPPGMSNFSNPNDRGRPRIVIKVLLKDVHEVWNRMVDSSKNEVTIEDLQGYLSAINSMAASLTGLPMSLLRLHHLQTPCVTLSSSGKVRLMCQRSVTSVIQSFLDVFLQRTTTYKSENYLQDLDQADSIAELNNNYE
ncbi:centromere protein L-like isoform X2 [Eriocheir sinensis]|uniref:centromere protein L-like isoform X2 n=1 Tax=Eriocheir sinensis TaxID=95602 RepID=UPI0021C7F4CE|nr:centromere protein L-like isoform X2 [Eriocheir sinensis]